MLLEQIIPKKNVNQDRRRIEMAVIIQRGHHLFFKIYNYNLTIIIPVYFSVVCVGFLHAQGHIVLIPTLRYQAMEFLFSLLPVLYDPIYLSGDLLDTHLLSPLCVSHCAWHRDVAVNEIFTVTALIGCIK